MSYFVAFLLYALAYLKADYKIVTFQLLERKKFNTVDFIQGCRSRPFLTFPAPAPAQREGVGVGAGAGAGPKKRLRLQQP